MNPYQVMGMIACCIVVFAGVVSLLTMQGVPLLLALLIVYLCAVWAMITMQRRAREMYDGDLHPGQRSYDRETATRRVRINALADNDENLVSQRSMRA